MKRITLERYLADKNHLQADLAEAFGKTQAWASWLVLKYPDAKLTLDKGKPVEIAYKVEKVIRA